MNLKLPDVDGLVVPEYHVGKHDGVFIDFNEIKVKKTQVPLYSCTMVFLQLYSQSIGISMCKCV